MKNKILAACLVVCLLATAVIGTTRAYFTDKTEVVTNTFTSGNVDITLDEAPVDANGQETTGNRGNGNTYKLYPGKEYDKDPTVHIVKDSEDCYVLVKVENGLAGLEVATGNGDTIAEQMTANGWKAVEGDVTNVYVYTAGGAAPVVVTDETDLVVFENFTIAESATAGDLDAAKTASITITAYAIQAEGMSEKTAAELWTAGGWA